MERVGSTDYAGLTHHLHAAGSPVATARAVGYAVRAAEQAEARSALSTAIELWDQAVALHERIPDADPRDRVDLQVRLVRAHGNAGSLKLRDAVHRAIDEAAATGDTMLVARAVTAWDGALFWSQHVYGATDLKLLEWIGVALAEVPGTEVGLRSRLLACRALELEGSYDDAGYESALESVTLSRSLPDDGAATAFALMSLLATCAGRGSPRAATRSSRSCTTWPRSTSSGASTPSRTTCTSTTGSPAATSRRPTPTSAAPSGWPGSCTSATPSSPTASSPLSCRWCTATTRRRNRRTAWCWTSSRPSGAPRERDALGLPVHGAGTPRVASRRSSTPPVGPPRRSPRPASRRWCEPCSPPARSTRPARSGTGSAAAAGRVLAVLHDPAGRVGGAAR